MYEGGKCEIQPRRTDPGDTLPVMAGQANYPGPEPELSLNCSPVQSGPAGRAAAVTRRLLSVLSGMENTLITINCRILSPKYAACFLDGRFQCKG